MGASKFRQIITDKTPHLYEMVVTPYYRYLKAKEKRISNIEQVKVIAQNEYRHFVGKDLNLDNPKTFSEKLSWMKLHWYDENAATCVDKYLVRNYIEEKGLGYLLNELYAVYDSPDNIDVSLLPEKFVLKTTHDSGEHLIFCNGNKKSIDWKLVKKKLKRWLSVDYCYVSGEWPYHTNQPRVVCEKLLEDKERGDIVDYKFFCFNGKPQLIFYGSNRREHVHADLYDLDWNLLPIRYVYDGSGKASPKPKQLQEMLRYAEILSQDFPFVRVDFYEVEGKTVFGELTFFPSGGCRYFEPDDVNYWLGDLIKLPDEGHPWDYVFSDKRK